MGGYLRQLSPALAMHRPAILLLALTPFTAFAQPANDACSTAIALSCGQPVIGTTESATTDAAPTCGTGITAPGAWYRITGTGDQITLSTCPDEQFDTKLNVYTGGCGGLTCVAGNDDAGNGVFCSTVSFVSQTGTDYLILVQGYDNETGPFTLTVECAPPSPDVCQGALPIACGAPYTGTTEGATPDAAPFCGTGITAPGVWHSFTGTGQQVTITTCPDEQFDTKLNVFSGTCQALACVAGNDDASDGAYCSTVTFVAEEGVTYHVLVQGYDGETGPYTLTTACLSCGSPLDATVTPLDASAVVNWSSTNASAGFTVEHGPVGFAPGAGTATTGTLGVDGPPVSIGGLLPGTAYEAYVRESCDGSESPWAGPIAFTTLLEPPAANALCSGALPIACGGSVEGNTEEGILLPGPACGAANITAKGLWYAFTGTGDDATLSTCLNSAFDTKLSVFTGACGALTCVAGNDDGPGCAGNTSALTFQTSAGTAYLVLVHGYGQDAGGFTLTLTCAPACTAVGNDDCASATLLALQPVGGCESSMGSTACAFAPATPNPPCDPYANIVDAWYAFNTGWGTDLSLILAAESAERIHAALYTACDAPAYVECWMDVTAPIPLAELEPNTDMLVRVWNSGGSEAGSFSICVEGTFSVAMEELPAGTAVRVWPVPSAGELCIHTRSPQRRIALIDLQGRTVLVAHPQDLLPARVDISGLAPGTYLVHGEDGFLGRCVKE
jgi:hypothetical protein